MQKLFSRLFISACFIIAGAALQMPQCASAQVRDLTGKWQWENDELHAYVYFSDQKYFIEAFLKDSYSQVSEGFSFYFTTGDTLIFNKVPPADGREPVAYFHIASYSDSKMQLVSLRDGEKNNYKRIDSNYYAISKYRANEYYYAGGTNVCVSTEVTDTNDPCLTFGSISVNSTISEIEAVLGKPYDMMEQAGRYYRVYLLETLDDGSQPYFALEQEDGQLRSIQITGNGCKEPLSFSSVDLGDHYSYVEQKLGKPAEKGLVDKETEHWSYAPFRFSFEIRNGLVYSIKLNKP